MLRASLGMENVPNNKSVSSVTITSIIRITYLTSINLFDGTCKYDSVCEQKKRIISTLRLFSSILIRITGTETDPIIWTIAEVCVAVVSACLPTLRPIFSRRNNIPSLPGSTILKPYRPIACNSSCNGSATRTEAPLIQLKTDRATVDVESFAGL